MTPQQNQEPIKPFLGLEESNLHLFVSRCCGAALSVEPLCRICCGQCGKPAPDPKPLSQQNQEPKGKYHKIHFILNGKFSIRDQDGRQLALSDTESDAQQIIDALNQQNQNKIQILAIRDLVHEFGADILTMRQERELEQRIAKLVQLPTPPKDL